MLPLLTKQDLFQNKSLFYLLTSVKGIGPSTSKKICTQLGIQQNYLLGHLNLNSKQVLNESIEKLAVKTQAELTDALNQHIKFIKQSGSYKGQRHLQCLPVHGQRTSSNARTQKSKRPGSQNLDRTAFRRKFSKKIKHVTRLQKTVSQKTSSFSPKKRSSSRRI